MDHFEAFAYLSQDSLRLLRKGGVCQGSNGSVDALTDEPAKIQTKKVYSKGRRVNSQMPTVGTPFAITIGAGLVESFWLQD